MGGISKYVYVCMRVRVYVCIKGQGGARGKEVDQLIRYIMVFRES